MTTRAKRFAILFLFSVGFATLTVSSFTRKSATDDEPVHVAMGYAALKLHDYRIHPETPPFLRLWATLPLLAMDGVQLDTNSVFWAQGDKWQFAHEFMYRQNDADRLLYAARFMIVLLGILLGILLFCWAEEWFGLRTAAVVLGLYMLEPNLLAHSRLATTDLGVTCFIFGAMYFLWRTTQTLTLGNVAGLSLFFALAQVSKTTALLLIPLTMVLLGIRVAHRSPWPGELGRPREFEGLGRKALVALALLLELLLVSYGAIWAVYGFRYRPTPAVEVVYRWDADPGIQQRTPRLAQAVGWVERGRLLPNAFVQGFLKEQARGGELLFYFGGKLHRGRLWYYFPVTFAIKTALTLLLLSGAGLILSLRRPGPLRGNYLFALLPVGVAFAAATQAALNVGLRHILAVYPFVLLVAGLTIAWLWRRSPRVLALVCVAYVAEVAWIYPDYLTYFNWAVGGPRHGAAIVADSNVDWGQDLKPLKVWMDRQGIRHINLSYFGTADPEYYQIDCTYLPGSPFFARSRVTRPRLPGYVAVSVNQLYMSQATDWGRALYGPLLEREPDAIIGYSIYVYRVGSPGPEG